MTYNLGDYSVSATKQPGGATEFDTRNANGETISVVSLKGAEAARMAMNLWSLHALICLKGR